MTAVPETTPPTAPAPKRAVRAAFDKAAPAYDAVAHVQRTACDRLLSLAGADPAFCPNTVLDAGCGTGYALPGLAARFPAARLLALDFAPAMLARHPAGLALPVCGDLEHLPLAPASIDALWSSYAIQWCEPSRTLAGMARVLRPGGRLWLCTLGPGTLGELRAAFRAVDGGEGAHVLRFTPPEQLATHLAAAGFRVLHHERATLKAWAPDLMSLLKDIKTLGAHQTGARRAPLGKAAWARLSAAYEGYREAPGLPASYDTLWYLAEAPPGPR